MTVKELEAAFTAAAENTMQKAEALGLDSASLRAQCEKHGAAACLKRCIQRGQEIPLSRELTAAGQTGLRLEALAVESRFAELFTDEEINACPPDRSRLLQNLTPAAGGSRAAGCAGALLWRTQPGDDIVPGFSAVLAGSAASE